MRRMLLAMTVIAGFGGAVGRAEAAIDGNKITIGVLTDLTGGNATAAGEGSVTAAQLAADEARAMFPGVTIEVISADHQNKADIASTITRDWVANRAVNVVADVPFSSAALAVNEAVRGAPRTIFVASGPGASEMTGTACSPNLVHWTYDTFATSSAVVHALIDQGLKSWFFISADYAFGAALERDGSRIIKQMGGTVVGGVKNPPFSSDYSSFLLTAQSSGAQVVAFANATIDLINLMKQAREFGMGTAEQRLAGFLVLITDVQSLGLQTAQGLYLASPFYWDFDDRSRAFSARFAERMRGAKPTMLQAGVYSGLVHYFKAVKQTNTTDSGPVMAAMKAMPADDDAFGKGSVRPDGRALHDFHLFQVKSPAESKGPWDDYKLISTIPGAQAFRPMAEGGCKLVQ